MSSELKYKVADLQLAVMVLEEENRCLKMTSERSSILVREESLRKMQDYVFQVTQENLELKQNLAAAQKEKEDLKKVINALCWQLSETRQSWRTMRDSIKNFKKDVFQWFYLKEEAPAPSTPEMEMHRRMLKTFLESLD